MRFSSGSKEPVSHVEPPPDFQLSPFHVSLPGSPGPGIVQNRQARRPVFASTALMYPRCAESPPVTPTTTLLFTTIGAPVMLQPHSFILSTVTFHVSFPGFASRATTWLSMVPMKTCPLPI